MDQNEWPTDADAPVVAYDNYYDRDVFNGTVPKVDLARPTAAVPLALYGKEEGKYQVQEFEVMPKSTLGLPKVEDSLAAMTNSYNELIDALSRTVLEQVGLHEDEINLKAKEAGIRSSTDPKVLGSNEEMRKAKVDQMLEGDRKLILLRTKTLMFLKNEEEIARIRCRLADKVLEHIKIAHNDKALEEYGATAL